MALTYLPTRNAKVKLYDITQKISGVLYEQYMKFVPFAPENRLHTARASKTELNSETEAKAEPGAKEEKTEETEQSVIEGIDIDKLIENVKEETATADDPENKVEEAKGSIVDDDISSTDSEAERNLTLLKSKVEKKKKAKAKQKAKTKTKPKVKTKRKQSKKKEIEETLRTPMSIAEPFKSRSKPQDITPNKNYTVYDYKKSMLIPTATHISELQCIPDNPIKVRKLLTSEHRRYANNNNITNISCVYSPGESRNRRIGEVELSLQGMRINRPTPPPIEQLIKFEELFSEKQLGGTDLVTLTL